MAWNLFDILVLDFEMHYQKKSEMLHQHFPFKSKLMKSQLLNKVSQWSIVFWAMFELKLCKIYKSRINLYDQI